MWNYTKPINEMSAEEIRLQEIFTYIQEIEARLRKIEFVLDELYLKAQLSNLMLTVQNISEEKMAQIKKILN